jgi:phospholipid/cholesterol/gamma-HCH transport system substrate-binding protein
MRPRHTRGPAVVVAAISCALTLSACEAYNLPLPGSPVDEDQSIEVTAEFQDVLNLVPRSPVKVNDVTVGEVTDIRRVGWRAEATMLVQDDVELPANVIADIRQTSLLGEKYVALEAPVSSPRGVLRDGATIGLERTGENPELEDVLGALALILNGGGVGQLDTIITEINKVFSGRQDRARHVLRELERLVGGLDEQKQDIVGAMEAMNSLSSTLNEQREVVTDALDAFGPAVTILADQRKALMQMLGALDRLGAVGTRVINASKKSLLADLRHLAPILREIADADDRVPDALGLAISYPFPIESNNIVHGDFANTEIVFSVDLHNLFNNPGDTPGGGLPELPELPGPGLPDPGLPGGGDGDGDGGLPDLPGLGRAPAETPVTSAGTAWSLSQLLGGGR